ncbi:hypothetical protein BC567DRAFT_213621 [Phyllosticta citribraziliensis]
MVKTQQLAIIDSTSAPNSLEQDLREFEQTTTVPSINTLHAFSAICQRYGLMKKTLWLKLSDGHRKLVATAEACFGTLAKKGVCFDTSLTPYDIQEARTILKVGKMAPKTREQASPSPRARRPLDSNSLAHAPSPAKRPKTEGAPLSTVSRTINPIDGSQDAAFQPESSAVKLHTEGDEQAGHDKEQGVQPATVEGETHPMDQDFDFNSGLLGEDGTAAMPTEVGRHEPHSESIISEDEFDFANEELQSVKQSSKMPTPAITLFGAGPTRPNSSQPFAPFSLSHEGKSGFSPSRLPRHRSTSSIFFESRATRLSASRPPVQPPERINSTFQLSPSQTRAHPSTPISSSSRHNLEKDPEKDANSMYQPDASRFQDGKRLSDNEVWQVLGMFKGLGCRFLAISPPDDDDWDKWSSVQSRPFSSDKKARMVVAPLCRRNHWILFSLHVETGQVDFFDSVRSKDTPYSHIGRAILRACGTSSGQDTFAASDCPQQQGSTDCGVFILAECFYLLAQRTLPKEIDAKVWRRILQFALTEEESIDIAALVPQVQDSDAILATELISWYQKAKKALQLVVEHENTAFEASAIISQIYTMARKHAESPDDDYDDAGKLEKERIAMREDLLQQLADLSPEQDDANDIRAVQALSESIALRKQKLKDITDERAKHAKQACRIERLSQAVQDMRLRLGMKGAELRGKIRSVGLLMDQIGRASAG